MEPAEYLTMRALEDTYWWYRGLHALVSKMARQSLAENPNATVLDAGCGTGGTMSALAPHDSRCRVIGIDLNAAAIAFATRRGAGAVARASVEELPFPDETFDLVISTDVLYIEGVDDAKAMKEISRVLKSGGRMIVNLPAFEFLRGEHDLAVHTLRRYSKHSLQTLMRSAGLRVMLISYWNTVLFPVVAIMRPLSRFFGKKHSPRSDLRKLPGPLNWLLSRIVLAEAGLLIRVPLPFGSSIFATGTKGTAR